ncbi:unnamed protein product [Closterium sp. NIES-53]
MTHFGPEPRSAEIRPRHDHHRHLSRRLKSWSSPRVAAAVFLVVFFHSGPWNPYSPRDGVPRHDQAASSVRAASDSSSRSNGIMLAAAAVRIEEKPRETLRMSDEARVAARFAGRRLVEGSAAGGSWLSFLATSTAAARGRYEEDQNDEDTLIESEQLQNLQLASNGRIGTARAACPQDVDLDAAFAVCTALDSHRDVKSYKDSKGHCNENGAYSRHNQNYDVTGTGKWYIEEQYYGFLFIQAGLAFNNSDAIRLGMKIFDWGFEQMDANGSFSCPDVYHSAGFFLESAARATLLLRHSRLGNQPRYKRWIRNAASDVAAMAAWFVRPEIERIGWKNDAVHTHRRYLTGTALGMAGILTENQTLIEQSIKYIRSGMAMQDPAGFNYERRGYDCSYQGIGLVYAARYYLYVVPHIQDGSESMEIRSRLLEVGRRGVDWLVTRVDERGMLNATGNTRTGSAQEVGRNGKPKALARKDVFHALLYWSWVLSDPEVELVAWRVERERTRRVRDNRCDCRNGFDWGQKNGDLQNMVEY